MKILSIETSCDETAAAVVEDGVKEICSVVSSSKDFHEKTGGIVPEVAARKQIEFIVPVIDQTLKEFGFSVTDAQKEIDAIAVTVGPGLIGSLVVGVEAAKALALSWNKPLISVNHLVGHFYANFLTEDTSKNIKFPAVVMVVSGGHTDLILMKGHGNFEYIGGTLDDAAGEAFDKTARLLGLAKYLGGRMLSEKALDCKENILKNKLPRPMLNQDNFDFSFSGLKTAVKRLVQNGDYPVECICREFEDAVVEVLVEKTFKAVKKYNAVSVLLGGGVSANSRLRDEMKKHAEKEKIELHIPPLRLCTDNAVYIASAAFFNQKQVPLEKIYPDPSLGIMDFIK